MWVRLWLIDGSCIRLRANWQNHVWDYDFVEGGTHTGRPFRMLTVIDEYSREWLAIKVKPRLRSDDVLHCLNQLFTWHGLTRSHPLLQWTCVHRPSRPQLAAQDRNDTLFIEPNSPWESGYNGSFIDKLRDELLASEIFYTLKEAKVLNRHSRYNYNTIRPRSSLG